jgi:hypothetical protein
MSTFRSVKTSEIAKAFACAHHYAQTAGSNEDRARFRHVARLIWDACGESAMMPRILPDNLRILVDASESETDTPPGRADQTPDSTQPTEAKS